MAIFNGNSTDVALNKNLTKLRMYRFTLPVAKLGHGYAFLQNNGGDIGKAAVGWLNYQLKDDMSAAGRGMFFGNNCFMCCHLGRVKKGF